MAAVAQLDLNAALAKFGLQSFRKGQLEVIQHILAGNDCLCVMPTGGGKSLCYQLPSIVRQGLTIVVSPLIALMKDQVDSLVRRGISATLINSSLSNQEQNERLDQVASGKFSMVYVAPERLRNQRFLDAIRATPVQLLAVDEAHCISEWGHDFRPDYQRLGRFREALGDVQTIALTATATPRVREDIVASLRLDVAQHFITGFARDNLYFGSVFCMSDRDKDRHLTKFLEGNKDSGIVYVATRKRCESLVEQLSKELKMSIGAYHAGLMPDQRKFIQEKFMAGEIQTIVATNAFGMGIDKSDLRYVVHYNMPGTLEAYYQEAGRAGRDGLLSQCVLLFSPQDRFIQEFFIENANPPRELLESLYDFLSHRPEDPIEFTAEEMRELINRPATAEAINSSLQILGRTGVLERLEVSGGLAMFRLSSRLPSFIDLLPRDATVRRTVLRTLEKAIGDRRDEAVYIHPRWLMEQLEMDRDTMNRHLRELTKLEDFEYVPPFRGRAIHFRQKQVPFDDLKIDHDGLAARKKADYEKLDQMVAYARTNDCRQKTILEYFGDMSATKCGICDRCQGRSGWPKLPASASSSGSSSKSNSKSSKKAKNSNAEPTQVDPTISKTEDLASSQDDSLASIASTPTTARSNASRMDTGITSSDPITSDRSGPHDNTAAAHSSMPPASMTSASKKAKSKTIEFTAEQTRDAVAMLQTIFGAIDRTHGYLSKTILTQHFAGTENKAIQGLRLQRLPEFGILKHWRRSYPGNLIDLLLDHELLLLTEIRIGKLTIILTDRGQSCIKNAEAIPIEVLDFVRHANLGEDARAKSPNASSAAATKTLTQPLSSSDSPPKPPPSTFASDEPAATKSVLKHDDADSPHERTNVTQQPVDSLSATPLPATRLPVTSSNSPSAAAASPATSSSTAKPQQPRTSSHSHSGSDSGRGIPTTRSNTTNPSATTSYTEAHSDTKSPRSTTPIPSSGLAGVAPSDASQKECLEVRPETNLPNTNLQDAALGRSAFPVLEDWRWTLRLVQHGYRLGECALLRRKTPEQTLGDLSIALQHGFLVPIEQLFDRRTQIAIRELADQGSIPDSPPSTFAAIPGLWDFILQWIKSDSRLH